MRKRNLWILIVTAALLPFFLSSMPLPPGAATDPVTTDHFQVSWGGTNTSFQSIEGLGSQVEVLEYRDGLSPDYTVNKLPGRIYFMNIILRRQIRKNDNELWAWYAQSLRGTPEYRDMTISILNRQHEPVVTYKISKAWPCAYRGPVLKGSERQVALEEIEIAYKSMTVENE